MPEPTTSTLQNFIPKLWAENIVRDIQMWVKTYYEALSPEELAASKKWIKRKNHYLGKVAWGKKHHKAHKRRG